MNSAMTRAKRLAKVLCRIELKQYAGDLYLQRIKDEIKDKCDIVVKDLIANKKKDISSAEPIFISPNIGQIFMYARLATHLRHLLDAVEAHFPVIKEVFDKAIAFEGMKVIEKAADHYVSF